MTQEVRKLADKPNKPKNVTVSLSEEEYEDLDFILDYYQSNSIANVTRTDVVKHMIKITKRNIESKQKSADINE